MRRVVLVSVLAGCETFFPLEPPPQIKRTIEIDQPSQATLIDFPVNITFADPEASLVRPDGRDIRFFDANGVALDHEVTFTDPDTSSGGQLPSFNAWVRIPELPPDTIEIDMLWGDNTDVGDNKVAVWEPGFVGVFHLSEGGSGAADSSRQGHQLTPDPDGAPGQISGISGPGLDFEVGDRMCLDAINDIEAGTESFTYSLWVNVAASAGDNDRVLDGGGPAATVPGFNFELGSDIWVANVADGTKKVTSTASAELLGEWVHLVAVIDREATILRTFASATPGMTEGDLDMLDSLNTPSVPLCLGRPDGAADVFRGHVDEVIFYKGVLPADWVLAHYVNLARPSDMITFR